MSRAVLASGMNLYFKLTLKCAIIADKLSESGILPMSKNVFMETKDEWMLGHLRFRSLLGHSINSFSAFSNLTFS